MVTTNRARFVFFKVSGAFDGQATTELKRAGRQAIQDGSGMLIDLTETTAIFADSHGLSAICRLSEELGRKRLCIIKPATRSAAYQISGYAGLFESIFSTDDTGKALEYLCSG